MTDPNIADMIAAKRAAGPDLELEKLLVERWYCPNCKEGRTILDTAINPGKAGSGFACRVCDQVGVTPVCGESHVKFRRLLNMLAPFNKAGRA